VAGERGVVDPRLDSPPQSHVTSGRQCDSGAPLFLSGVGQECEGVPKDLLLITPTRMAAMAMATCFPFRHLVSVGVRDLASE